MFSTSLFAEWQFVGKNSAGSEYYFNTDVVMDIDKYRYSFQLVNYQKDVNGALSVIVYNKIDCNTLRNKVLNFDWYNEEMGEGEILPIGNRKQEWRYPKPKSIGEKIAEKICKINVDKFNTNSLNWLKINTNVEYETYIDVNSVRKVDEFIYVWTLSNFSEALSGKEGNFNSVKVYEQINCLIGKAKRLDYRFHQDKMGSGEYLSNKGDDEWIYAAPGTIDRQVQMTICSLYSDD